MMHDRSNLFRCNFALCKLDCQLLACKLPAVQKNSNQRFALPVNMTQKALKCTSIRCESLGAFPHSVCCPRQIILRQTVCLGDGMAFFSRNHRVALSFLLTLLDILIDLVNVIIETCRVLVANSMDFVDNWIIHRFPPATLR